MKKKLDLIALEIHFNYIIKEINGCIFSFLPKAKRLTKELNSYLSDLDFIKDLSYSFKLEVETLKLEYPIPEELQFEINASIFDLELDLVHLAKYPNKFDIMSRWFASYHELNNFIVQNSTKTYIHKSTVLDEEQSVPEAKVLKFSHLL